MTEETNNENNPPPGTGDNTPPATPPATPDPNADGEDKDLEALATKVMEKIRTTFRPSSGGGNSLRDMEEIARRAVVDATSHLQKEQERDSLINELKEKVEKELSPKKYKGLAGFMFGHGDDDK